ncbi:SGNH/GDSL hydrolase family protein [Nocardioides sp. cx-173]|uniref:SGNH/GDSL hydrolase family protein n=1 Tax=Nocardioides sp. cx-173 TaxID=2898796 RepID=UPI001E604E67|nr:SGNH/GDSL hydrolase family protein [Nocardioides sp. cx-173]MCD4527098.1 SGNH/GDSL hydrolase family protein [Nocardioides sp. cx-173]UGB42461.1 SGNH/GDSL hydrolase family protein [Nocardioides sp. cx-173]
MVIRGIAVRTPLFATLVVVLLATLAVTFQLTVGAQGAGAERCERFAQAASARAERDTSGEGPRVVVIGDSYSVGLRLDHPDRSWPSRLPGPVHVAGFSGSGFSARASACGRVSFADRAPHALKRGADLVVVQGGLNDHDRTAAEIGAGFRALVRAVGDRSLLVVGPPPAPVRGSEVGRVDAVLAALAARHGATYLSMVEADLPYLDDGLHLTSEGHREFGDLVNESVLQVIEVQVPDGS